jgi:hypothetical protein
VANDPVSQCHERSEGNYGYFRFADKNEAAARRTYAWCVGAGSRLGVQDCLERSVCGSITTMDAVLQPWMQARRAFRRYESTKVAFNFP